MRMSTGAWIGGEERLLERRYGVISPVTGEVLAEVADAGPAEAREALEHAVRAFERWRKTPPYERSAVLGRWFEAILANAEELAQLMTLEMGKVIREARGEVAYAAGFVEFYAEEIKRAAGEYFASRAPHRRVLVRYEPVGPVYAITPWNFPAAMVTRKVAPAVAAGAAVVLKPAEESPLTALYLARLFHKAGGPPGVLQVLPTTDPAAFSRPFFEDARVRKLTFTGSTEVGLRLYVEAAKTLKRVSLELGGGAPAVVFADADLDRAVNELIRAKFRNSGQSCIAANRFFVEARIAEVFAERYAEAVSRLKVGDPRDETTDVGPLVNPQAVEKVRAHVEDAARRGAKTVVGGAGEGLYFRPTVLLDVPPDARVMREETFGPVAPVAVFETEEEAVRLANASEAGLAAYLFTENLGRAFRVSEALEYGIVAVNEGVPSTPEAPFGGVKFSGIGREGGRQGLFEYLEAKYVALAL